MKTEKEEAIDRLKGWLAPGDTVYTVLRHTSRSGMSRLIDLYAFRTDDAGKLFKVYLSYNAATVLGWKYDDGKHAMKVGGCGMDMGFHAVYTLSRALFGDGYALNHEWI